MLNSITQPVVSWFQRWAASRRPKGSQFTLDQKKIFIFPTASGWAFLLICIVVFLVGTNYQNNLIQAVAFFLIALGILSIHYTYLNLSGLKIKLLKGFSCYAGEMAEFTLQLSSDNRRTYSGLNFSWNGSVVQPAVLEEGLISTLNLYVQTERRGFFRPGPLLVQTRFPFGLLRAWSWMEPDISILVYPKPVQAREPVIEFNSAEGEIAGKEDSGEDFSGLNEYKPGDSSRRIAWKQFAQGRGLLTKSYVGSSEKRLWLMLEQWPELSIEGQLSAICYWAQIFDHQRVDYGLSLPATRITPSNGPGHLEKVLIALAQYPNGRAQV